MPIIEARIATDTPGRYLRQFCKHAAAMGERRARGLPPHNRRAASSLPTNPPGGAEMRVRVESSDSVGTVEFDPLGRCVVRALDAALVVRVEAADDRVMYRIRDIVTRDFERFGRDTLRVDWHEVDDGRTDPSGANG